MTGILAVNQITDELGTGSPSFPNKISLSDLSITGTPDSTTFLRGDGVWQAVEGIGSGQTWQDVKASRALGVTYTNTTGKPIEVSVTAQQSTATVAYLTATVSGVLVGRYGTGIASNGFSGNATFIVPPGDTYSVTATNSVTFLYWTELR